MVHTEYTMLMSLILDGEGDDLDRARLQEHLRSCGRCASTWQRWQELDRHFALAPMLPAPVDLATRVAGRLDTRQAEQARHRWFILGLALAWSVIVIFTVAALGFTNGWHNLLAPDQGPLAAAYSALASTGGWVWREFVGVVTQFGAPMIAATAGVLLCATCGLIMAWLWLVARLSMHGPGVLTSVE